MSKKGPTKNQNKEAVPLGVKTPDEQKQVKSSVAGIYIEGRDGQPTLWFDPTTLTYITDRVLPFRNMADAKRNNDTAINVYNYYEYYLDGYMSPNIFGKSTRRERYIDADQYVRLVDDKKTDVE